MPAPNPPAAAPAAPNNMGGTGNGEQNSGVSDDLSEPTTPAGSIGIGAAPIELDLSGSGIGVTQLTSSNIFEPINMDG